MKAKYIVIASIFGLSILFFVWFFQTMGGGTLGATAKIKLSCSQSHAKQQLDELLMTNPFKVTESDSSIVKYWERHGYYFLDYVCINIQGRLYMISVSPESELSVRAYYNREKTTWMHIVDFSGSDKKESKKAQEYLITHLKGC